MSRPVAADAAATRARILDSALTRFSSRGVDAVSIRDIAGGAGVSLAMVHHYFGSKEELFETCIGSVYDELLSLRGHLATALADGTPSSLSSLVTSAFLFAREHRVAVRLMIRTTITQGSLPPRGLSLLLSFLEEVTRVLGTRLGVPPQDLRLPLQSLIFLIARYAVHDDSELARIAGVPDGNPSLERVSEHLTSLASLLFEPSALQLLPLRAAG